MIPNSILLPPLSLKERADLEALCADHRAGVERIEAFSNDARVARKRELREKIGSAPTGQLLSLGAELEMLETSFAQAKSGAKLQLKAIGPRYVSLLTKLLDKAQLHANELISKSNSEWAKHFAVFGAQPTAESPITAFLSGWKKALLEKRKYLQTVEVNGVTPNPPLLVLPYLPTPEKRK